MSSSSLETQTVVSSRVATDQHRFYFSFQSVNLLCAADPRAADLLIEINQEQANA